MRCEDAEVNALFKEISMYACPWSLLCGGQGRSWAMSDTPNTFPGVEH